MNALLPSRMVEKPWGRDVLPAPFAAPPGQRIGEVWFEPPPGLPQSAAAAPPVPEAPRILSAKALGKRKVGSW